MTTMREILIESRRLERLLDQWAANWANIPAPFNGMEKFEDWLVCYFALERQWIDQGNCGPLPKLTCAQCRAGFEPTFERVTMGSRRKPEIHWILRYIARPPLPRQRFDYGEWRELMGHAEWPVCSWDCREFLERRLKHFTKRRVTEWQNLKACRRLLAETRQIIKARRREVSSLPSAESEQVPTSQI